MKKSNKGALVSFRCLLILVSLFPCWAPLDSRAVSYPTLNAITCAAGPGEVRHRYEQGNRFRYQNGYSAAFDFGWAAGEAFHFQLASQAPFSLQIFRKRETGQGWVLVDTQPSVASGSSDHRVYFKTPNSPSEEVYRFVVVPAAPYQDLSHNMRILWRPECGAGGKCPRLSDYGFRNPSSALAVPHAKFVWHDGRGGGLTICVRNKYNASFLCAPIHAHALAGTGDMFRFAAEVVASSASFKRYSIRPCNSSGPHKGFTAEIVDPEYPPKTVYGRPGAVAWDGKNVNTGIDLKWYEW